jgi:hypothetical protein
MMLSTSQVADLLGKQYYQVLYLLKTRKPVEVTRFNNKRVFRPEDVLTLAEAFKLSRSRIAALEEHFNMASHEAGVNVGGDELRINE